MTSLNFSRQLKVLALVGSFILLEARATDFVVTLSIDDPFDGGNVAAETLDGGGLSLREAIGLANQNNGAPTSGDKDGDTITFLPKLPGGEIVLKSSIEITDDAVINGAQAAPPMITVNGSKADRIFIVNTSSSAGNNRRVVLEKIILREGKTAANGGAILVQPGSALQLNESVIADSEARNGGAIYADKSPVRISKTEITGNFAVNEGGGLWNQEDSEMRVDSRSIIRGNRAGGDDSANGGGGIFNNGGSLILDNISIIENGAVGKSGSGGGVLNVNKGTVRIVDTILRGNVANRAGGGIEDASGSDARTLRIDSSSLLENIAGPAGSEVPGNGGAIHITGPSGSAISNSVVSNNSAFSEGGAFWNGSGEMSISSSILEGNTAAGDAADNGGGALFNAGGILNVDSNTRIIGNLASGKAGSGGGIFNDGGQVNLFGSTFEKNVANRAGGAIEDKAGELVSIQRCRFLGNIAGQGATANPGNGGAIHLSGAGKLKVSGSTFSENLAANEGGGLWNSGTGRVLISQSSLQGNEAPDGGGLFSQAGEGELRVENVTIVENSASNQGGGARLEGGKNLFLHVTIIGNVATKAGGGISSGENTLLLHNSVIADNESVAGPDVAGEIDEPKHTLIRRPGGATGFNPGSDGNLAGIDPLLGILTESAPTVYAIPAGNSPLVDAGDPVLTGDVAFDQRGLGSLRVSNLPDLGSIEVRLLTYAEWIRFVFPPETPAGDLLPDSNPDNDCLSNQLEYLTGSNPFQPSAFPFEVGISDEYFDLTYPRSVFVPIGLEAMETSINLEKWEVNEDAEFIIDPGNLPNLSIGRFRLKRAGFPKLFGRLSLKVTE